MNRRTTWKIVASFCLIATLLPVFSALTPAMAESETIPPAPLPYALEFVEQEHNNVYKTSATVTVDGVKNDSEDYTLLTEKTSGDGNDSGIYSAALAMDNVKTPASEYRPDYLRIYASYNEAGINFFFEAKSRTSTDTANQSFLRLRFGTDFGSTATEAFTSVTGADHMVDMKFGSGNNVIDKVNGGCTIKASKVDNVEERTDSTGTYNLTEAVYEVQVPWSVLGFESFEDVNIDRFYFMARYYFWVSGSTHHYWTYGIHKNRVFPFKELTADSKVSAVYESEYSETVTAIPHVLNLAGEKPDSGVYTHTPEITGTPTATIDGGNYKISATYNLTADSQIAETGVLYADTASIGANNLVFSDSADKYVLTLDNGTATFSHNFAEADYKKFVSFRPYVKYEDGTVIYGEYFTISPCYYDLMYAPFDEEINVLMIGCSFNYYYLDELVAIAAADNIKINAYKAYYSGNPADRTWNWLIHDGAYWQFFSHDYLNLGGKVTNGQTLKQCLAALPEGQEWDYISVQDHYAPAESLTYEACMEESLPYLANIFRYLEVTEPQATLLLHETWAYDADHKDMLALAETDRDVNVHQENITKTIYKISESIAPANGKTVAGYENFPIVPSGAAWSHARNGVKIDGTTYKIEGTLTKDKYHDGETQGGQFLNACVWYEVLTGNSCIGNTWRPVGYTLDETKAIALQQIAHQAVADLYGADYAQSVARS